MEGKRNFTRSNELARRAERLIPAGCHTYSKGRDQFPEYGPGVLVRGQGCRTWDADGNEFLDWGMGLRSVILGHAYGPVLDVVREQLELGSNFTRPSALEGDLAEKIVELIPSAEMVKFAKNGSDVTTAALRLARAFTGRDHVAFCKDHPFFSFDDWFIGTTPACAGIPAQHVDLSHAFGYNDLASLEAVFQKHPGQIAAVILEPVTVPEPAEGFLQGVRDLADRHGAVLIFDEMISGFRWHLKGAQHYFGVTPDLSTFGKAIGNGFSTAVLAGRSEIMELGGLKHDQRRCFLLSATHGGETHALAAALKTIREIEEKDVVKHIWTIGEALQTGLKQVAEKHGLSGRMEVTGYPCSPLVVFRDGGGNVSMPLRTLFLQEMIDRGVLIPYVAICYSHDQAAVDETLAAADGALAVCREAIDSDTVGEKLIGAPTKPVFREFN